MIEIKDSEIIRIVRESSDLMEQVCSKYEATQSRIDELEKELARLKSSQGRSQNRKSNIDLTDKIDMIVEAVKSGNSNRRSILNKTGFSKVQYDTTIIEAVRSGRIVKNGDRASTFYTINPNS